VLDVALDAVRSVVTFSAIRGRVADAVRRGVTLPPIVGTVADTAGPRPEAADLPARYHAARLPMIDRLVPPGGRDRAVTALAGRLAKLLAAANTPMGQAGPSQASAAIGAGLFPSPGRHFRVGTK
jgi:hypothetical protein